MMPDTILTVKKYIKDNSLISEGDTVVIGLSGGVDSMVLCHILDKIRYTMSFKLFAAHLDHRIRMESGEDAFFVAAYCAKQNIPLYTSVVDVVNESKITKTSIEVAARNVRHAFFKGVLQEHNNAKLALAHHMNDKTETILMRLFRGTSIDGLNPMPCKDNSIIRPLMCLTRDEIIDFAKENNIEWREDTTNASTEYTRNYIRHDIVPKIEKLNPSFHQTMTNSAKSIERDVDYLNIVADNYINKATKTTDGYMMDKDDFADIHPAIRTRVIKKLFEKLGKTNDLYEVHINSVDNLFTSGRTGAVIEIDKYFSARCHPIGVELIRNQEIISSIKTTKIAMDGITYLSNNDAIECSIVPVPDKEKLKHTKNICYIDAMAVEGNMYIRSRQDGDTFHPFGSTGTKKLKDYFIDKKISRWERDNIPILATETNIVWVVGYTIEDRYRVDDDTSFCMKITYIKGE